MASTAAASSTFDAPYMVFGRLSSPKPLNADVQSCCTCVPAFLVDHTAIAESLRRDMRRICWTTDLPRGLRWV